MADVCISCGAKLITRETTANLSEKSEKDWTTTLLLAIFFWPLGIHRFYTGHTVMGIVYILTGGLFIIGSLIDLIMIISGSFRDSKGKVVTNR